MLLDVYILLSKKNDKLYVGSMSDLERRFERYNNGFVPATKARRPLILLYREMHMDNATAFQRERFLKSLWSARFKQKLRREYIKTIAWINPQAALRSGRPNIREANVLGDARLR